MKPADSDERGLPSVKERRWSRARLVQWLIVVAVVAVIGLGAVWLLHELSAVWHAAPKVPPGGGGQAANDKVFEWPQPSLPKPPLPDAMASDAAAQAKADLPQGQLGVNSAGRGGKASTPSDSMMLTEGAGGPPPASGLEAQGATQEPRRETNLPQPAAGERAVRARWIGDRNFILARGTAFDCILDTKMVSNVAGIVTCTVPRNVYSDNGRVVLIERGSTLTGEYRANLRPGAERIYVLWDRVKSVNGVVVALDSPGAGPLGEAGLGGDVDNHWWKRIGAAVLLSLVQDAVAYKTSQNTAGSGTSTVVLPNTSQQGDTLAGKILDQTINIPPTLTLNQGSRVMIMVAHDLDFGSVYELRVH